MICDLIFIVAYELIFENSDFILPDREKGTAKICRSI